MLKLDATFTDRSILPVVEKPFPVAPGHEPFFWDVSQFSQMDPAGSGHGVRVFNTQKVREYVDRFKGITSGPIETNQPVPPAYHRRVACLDVEQHASLGAIPDADRWVRYAINALRRKLPGVLFVLAGHDLGRPPSGSPEPDNGAHYYPERFGWPASREWIRWRCDQQGKLMRACGCAWITGYFSQPSSVDREIASIENQAEMFREAYGPAVKLMVWLYGAYIVQEHGKVTEDVWDKLMPVLIHLKLYGSIAWGPWCHSDDLVARLSEL